jgi:hypothetical protein
MRVFAAEEEQAHALTRGAKEVSSRLDEVANVAIVFENNASSGHILSRLWRAIRSMRNGNATGEA